MIRPRVALSLSFLHVFGIAAANRWVDLGQLPFARQEHSTVAIKDDYLAVVGGVLPIGEPGVSQSGIHTTDMLQLYNTTLKQWYTGSPVPFAVNHPNVATVDGNIYVLGGLIDDPTAPEDSVSWIASGESHVYDSKRNMWSPLEPMPKGTERGSAIMGVHGKIIYVAGGMTYLNQSGQDAITTVTAFNTISGHWQTLPSVAANLPEGRQHGTGAVFENTFYVICGRVVPRENGRDTVLALDLKHQAAGWKTVGHFPTARGGVTGALVGSRFYTFGGEGNVNNSAGVFNQTEVFDLKTRKSARLGVMAVPRHGTSAVAIKNKIYIPGGGLQQDGIPVTINGTTTYLDTSDTFNVYVV